MGPRFLLIVTACMTLVGVGCSTSQRAQPGAANVHRPVTTRGTTSAPSTPQLTSSMSATHGSAPANRAPVGSSTSGPAGSAQLPLHLFTGTARQLLTVVAASARSTDGMLQAWRRFGTAWVQVGPAVHAWLGVQGLTNHGSESLAATPIGSFTLTRAFGRNTNPGTQLPYHHTTPDDWWISQQGPLYNTMQRCGSGCPFTQGSPNEHLYFATPYYRYAVVIDYNTVNAPGGVVQGVGSAFFLHVTVNAPTQGCISIPEDQLVRLMRWLSPAAHPRILVGVRG